MGLFNKKELKKIAELEVEIAELRLQLANTENLLSLQKKQNDELGITSILESQARIAKDELEHEKKIEQLNLLNEKLSVKIDSLKETIVQLENERLDKETLLEKTSNQLDTQSQKLETIKELYKAINKLNNYDGSDEFILQKAEELVPSVIANLNCLDNKELRKKYKENEKNIKIVLNRYESRYNTKTNRALYKLMVIALQSELQNILTEMKYDKLESALSTVKEMCAKYYVITAEGNQSIATTVQRFISELENLFTNAVQIEYEYYVRKEQEKQEQAAIREQMRQEAAERKELERQRKQVEKEESKFVTEIENVKMQMLTEKENDKILALQAKIDELNAKLLKVNEHKEEIINRQNGKAGNVYVISNIGSFGDNVFKVGMTRRLEPMDRINELGDASVPFKFDVHAMIFSEDAVSLETKLHSILNDKRVNKVNLKKEFFRISLDEIEQIVLSEEPTANFKRTILALEYRQTVSLEEKNRLVGE